MPSSLTRRSSDGPGRACVTALASVVMTASFQARRPSEDNFGLSRCSSGAMLACAATTLSRYQAPLRTTRGASLRHTGTHDRQLLHRQQCLRPELLVPSQLFRSTYDACCISLSIGSI